MSPENFCYWLQGYFEVGQHQGASGILGTNAVEEIKNHLALVMQKLTPAIPAPYPMPRISDNVTTLPYIPPKLSDFAITPDKFGTTMTC